MSLKLFIHPEQLDDPLEISHLLRFKTCELSEILYNENHHSVRNIFSCHLNYDEQVFTLISASQKELLAWVDDDNSNRIFTGVIEPTFDSNISQFFEGMRIEIGDFTYLLDKKFDGYLQIPQLVDGISQPIFVRSNPNSILYQIFDRANLSHLISAAAPDIPTVVQQISLSGDQEYREIIDELLYEHNHVLICLPDGTFSWFKYGENTFTPTITIDREKSTAEPFVIRKVFTKQDGYELTWSLPEMIPQVRLWDANLPISPEGIFTGVDIAPGDYWPKDGEIRDIFQDYIERWLDIPYTQGTNRLENRDISLIATSNQTLSWSGEPGIQLLEESYEAFRAKILFRNTTSEIKRLFFVALYGDALIRTGVAKELVPTASKKPLPYTSKYIFEQNQADSLSTVGAQNVLYSDFEYEFYLNSLVPIGTVVRLKQESTPIDTSAIIVETRILWDRPTPLIFHRAIGLSEFDSLDSNTRVIYPVKTEISNQQIEARIVTPADLADRPTVTEVQNLIDTEINQTLDLSNDTWTPNVPNLGAISSGVDGRTIILGWTTPSPKPFSYDGYEVQRRKGTSGTFVEVGRTLTPPFTDRVELDVTSGNPINTTYQYRIRGRNKAGTTGNWSNPVVTVTARPTEAQDIVAGAITTAKLANGSVTEDIIASSAITSDKIGTGAVLEAKLANNAVTTNKINNGAILEAKLANNAVTTSKINNDAITSAKIGTGAVLEAKLADNAVTVAKVANGAITETKISDDSISTPKIQAGAITADTIATNAVTADKVNASAITADKIATNAVTAIKINASAVTTDKIASNAITASKIVVADFSNIITNPDFGTPSESPSPSLDGWIGSISAISSVGAGAPANCPARTTGVQTGRDVYFHKWVDVKPGEVWTLSVQCAQSGSSHNWGMGFEVFNASGVRIGWLVTPVTPATSTTWRLHEYNFTMPAGANRARPFFQINATSNFGNWYFTNVRYRKSVEAHLIVDGAITTAKINAGAVTANEIATNAVIADKINANAVTTAKIATGAVTANEIATNAVTAVKINAGAVTAGKIASEAVHAEKLSVLARDYVNPVSITGNIRGWGTVLEDGTGGTTRLSYNATENAIAFTANQNHGFSSRGFQIDHNKIYRLSFEIWKNTHGGNIYAGLRVGTSMLAGHDSNTSEATAIALPRFREDRLSVSPEANFYFINNTLSLNTKKRYVFYIIGANRSVDECPDHLVAPNSGTVTVHPYVQLTNTITHVSIRFLNWHNSITTRTLFVKDISVTEVGSGTIVAQNIKAGAIDVTKLNVQNLLAGDGVFNEIKGRLFDHATTSLKQGMKLDFTGDVGKNPIEVRKRATNDLSFWVDRDGNMHAVDGEFSGSIGSDGMITNATKDVGLAGSAQNDDSLFNAGLLVGSSPSALTSHPDQFAMLASLRMLHLGGFRLLVKRATSTGLPWHTYQSRGGLAITPALNGTTLTSLFAQRVGHGNVGLTLIAETPARAFLDVTEDLNNSFAYSFFANGNTSLFEKGSNSNGHYIRFSNGVQICYDKDYTEPSRSGSGVRSHNRMFPASFVSTDNTVSITACSTRPDNNSYSYRNSIGNPGTDTDRMRVFVWSVNATNRTYSYMVIGFWK